MTDGIVFIDDYETPDRAPALSSSGGTVTYNVTNLTEGRLDDNNSSFTLDGRRSVQRRHAGRPPATHGKGVVFDWNGANSYYEWAVVPALQRLLRPGSTSACAAPRARSTRTRWPTNGILTFTITLRDGAGHTSSINTGAYGGGFGMPYARSGRLAQRDAAHPHPYDGLPDQRQPAESDQHRGGAAATSARPGVRNQGRIVIDELMLDDDAPPFADGLNMAEDGENWE